MEMHLFNAAKPLRMERSYKAFFIDLKIPVSTLTTERLDEKTIKHLSILFRNFKINSKSTLWLYPGTGDSTTATGQDSEISGQRRKADDHPLRLTRAESDMMRSSKSIVTESNAFSSLASGSPCKHRGVQFNIEVNKAESKGKTTTESREDEKREGKGCHMDYSLYEIDGSLIDFFQNINRFTLHYHSTGELDLMPELSIEEPCIDIYLMLSLKKIVISNTIHRDNLSEAVVKAVTSKLRTSFIGPMQRILHTSSIKLNGPIIYNTISRCLATANSIRECVTIV